MRAGVKCKCGRFQKAGPLCKLALGRFVSGLMKEKELEMGCKWLCLAFQA